MLVLSYAQLKIGWIVAVWRGAPAFAGKADRDHRELFVFREVLRWCARLAACSLYQRQNPESTYFNESLCGVDESCNYNGSMNS